MGNSIRLKWVQKFPPSDWSSSKTPFLFRMVLGSVEFIKSFNRSFLTSSSHVFFRLQTTSILRAWAIHPELKPSRANGAQSRILVYPGSLSLWQTSPIALHFQSIKMQSLHHRRVQVVIAACNITLGRWLRIQVEYFCPWVNEQRQIDRTCLRYTCSVQRQLALRPPPPPQQKTCH